MIKYGVEFYSLVYPKWAKIRFKISDQGKFLFIMNPALTPGKLPEGIKPELFQKEQRYLIIQKKKSVLWL
jgi:hypothetical protein